MINTPLLIKSISYRSSAEHHAYASLLFKTHHNSGKSPQLQHAKIYHISYRSSAEHLAYASLLFKTHQIQANHHNHNMQKYIIVHQNQPQCMQITTITTCKNKSLSFKTHHNSWKSPQYEHAKIYHCYSKPTTMHENHHNYNMQKYIIVHQTPPQFMQIITITTCKNISLSIKTHHNACKSPQYEYAKICHCYSKPTTMQENHHNYNMPKYIIFLQNPPQCMKITKIIRV